MAYMLMPRSRHMTLFTADMEKQVGTLDCGLFAIAAATSLVYYHRIANGNKKK